MKPSKNFYKMSFTINRRKKSNSILLIFGGLLTAFIFLIPSPSNALIAPQVYFTDLTLEKESFMPGETIKGSVSLWNYEDYVMSDMVLNFEILGGEVDGIATQMIDQKKGEKTFSLLSGQETTQSFDYQLLSNLPEGTFKFRVQLTNGKGEEMSWIEKVINIGGEGEFLIIDNYWILKDEEKLPASGGVYYEEGEIPNVIFDVTNDSPFTINSFFQPITYKRNIGQSPEEGEKESVILEPGEKVTLETSLPSSIVPQTYLTEIRFYSTDSQEPISNSIYFRWIISGEEDAELLFASLDQDSYQAGDEATAQIQYTGPANFEFEGGEGIIEVQLYDENGELVGEGRKPVEMKAGQVAINVPIEKDVDNPRVVTQINKGDELLDEYAFQTTTETKGPTGPQEIEKESFFEKNQLLILVILLSIIMIGTIFYCLSKNKKMKNKKTFILLALLGVGLLFGKNALAAVEVTGGCCDTTIIFNSPHPQETYKLGDIVDFTGQFKVTSCGNGLFFNKVTFYITEDKDIPITDCAGRSNKVCDGEINQSCHLSPTYCYGGSSTRYPDCEIRWYNRVKYLDTEAINPETGQPYKIYELGTVYPSDVLQSSKPYWVPYHASFEIPSDLDFSGPVRFYVQYSGTHWHGHWHWQITYQPGKLNTSPTANNLKETEENFNTNYNHHLSWNYFDPDGHNEKKFWLQLDNNSDFSSPEIDREISSNVPSGSLNEQRVYVSMEPEDNKILYDTTYYWRVKVQDSQEEKSAWILAEKSFTTAPHPCPSVNFDWSPYEPNERQDVAFNDTTETYGGTIPITWYWTFEDANISDSIEQNPIARFLFSGSKIVTLKVTDSDGFSDSRSKTINIFQVAPPEWEETAPQ